MRSRRQPVTSGTTTSSPKCSSGSWRIHQPPGPARPRSNAGPSANLRCDFASAASGAGRGLTYSRPATISATRCAGASITSW